MTRKREEGQTAACRFHQHDFFGRWMLSRKVAIDVSNKSTKSDLLRNTIAVDCRVVVIIIDVLLL